MFSRANATRSPAALRRNVLGLLAIIWLNMAALPCAMAFQGDDDCPHCPPAEQHGQDHGMSAHHGDDAAASGPSCATVQSDCCDSIAASVDTRTGKIEYKPATDVVLASAPLPDNYGDHLGTQPCGSPDPPDVSGSSPPLRVLYCVYLK